MVLLCALAAFAPPAALLLFRAQDWLPPTESIDPSTVQGQVLHFTADWCGACRASRPAVQEVRAEGYSIRTINVDTHQALAQKYGVRGIPTFIYVLDGEEIRRTSGARTADELRQLFRPRHSWF